MKKILLLVSVCFVLQNRSMAQSGADVKTADAIIKALYEVISGPTTQVRNWNRFQSLFAPGARLITAIPHADSGTVVRIITPEQYAQRNGTRLQELGFSERELHRITESHGAITQIFSTYETLVTSNGQQQTMRGINSIQLYHDKDRYYILTICWDGDSKQSVAPRYLQ